MDRNYFLQLVNKEEERIRRLCDYWNEVERRQDIPDEAAGKIRAAIGQSGLLLAKKFKQFRQLCEGTNNGKTALASDLQGFWDMISIQVDNVTHAFTTLQMYKDNSWKENEVKDNHSPMRPSPNKRKTMQRQVAVEKQTAESPKVTAQAIEKAKVREMYRKQLLEMKKEGRKRVPRKMSDSIEIFAPDAMIIESPHNYN